MDSDDSTPESRRQWEREFEEKERQREEKLQADLTAANEKFGKDLDFSFSTKPSEEEIKARHVQMYYYLLTGEDDKFFRDLHYWQFLLGESEWWSHYPKELQQKMMNIEDQWRIEHRCPNDIGGEFQCGNYKYFLP
jgi:hypothetical protein